MPPIPLAIKKRIKDNTELVRSVGKGRQSSTLASIVWEPHPQNKPQVEAFLSPADRLFYGGRAGGGPENQTLFSAWRSLLI